MATHEERIRTLEVEMFFGDGKDKQPITTRLTMIEETISSLKTVKWLLAGAIITAVFNILSSHVSFRF